MLERVPDSLIPDEATFWNELGGKVPPGMLSQGMYRPVHQQQRLQKVLQLLRDIPDSRSAKVLEVGCVEGYVTAMIAQLVDTVDAFDISPVLIRHCPRLENVHYFVADAERWQPQCDYDGIVMTEVLEHLRDPKRVIQEYSEWARWILASCPVQETLNPVRAFDHTLYGVETRNGDASGHIWAMDAAGFLELFGDLPVIEFMCIGVSAIALVQGGLADA